MRIIITGVGGFLGQHLLQQLQKDTAISVSGLTSQVGYLTKKFEGNKNFRFYEKNDFGLIPWSGIDALINCAFPRNTDGIMMADGLSYIKNMLITAVESGVRSVINISSQSVYSQKRLKAADEKEPLNLGSSYAVGKYASELLINAICKNIPHTNIRMASLIGVAFEQRVVNKLVKQAIAGDDLHIKDNKQQFGFLDVRDAVDALVKMLKSDPKSWKEVYNLSQNREYTLLEIANCVADLAEELLYRKVAVCAEPDESYSSSALDSGQFYRQFSWKPIYSLEMTVRDIYQANM